MNRPSLLIAAIGFASLCAHAQDMKGVKMPSAQSTRTQGETKGMKMPSTQSRQTQDGMKGMPMPSARPVHEQGEQAPESPTDLQHLEAGSIIGTRPAPGGLVERPNAVPVNQSMDLSSMEGGRAPPDARSPDYSDGYRYGTMGGMRMADNDAFGGLKLDELEYARSRHGGGAVFIDGEGWYGKDLNKVWFKAEGESHGGTLQDLRTEALWNRVVTPFWSTQLGVRHDAGLGPDRNWAAFGVEGLAPYRVETEATFYVGQDSRSAARFDIEYEALMTQRLILRPRLEVNMYGKDDPQRGIGSGLSDAEVGLRLRYDVKREFSPYIGLVYRKRYGHTADFARAEGEQADDLEVVAGLRMWFF